MVLLKDDKQFKYRGMQNARSFAEYALNPFIHERSISEELPEYREGL